MRQGLALPLIDVSEHGYMRRPAAENRSTAAA
jgi:hypothetical protein